MATKGCNTHQRRPKRCVVLQPSEWRVNLEENQKSPLKPETNIIHAREGAKKPQKINRGTMQRLRNPPNDNN